MIDEETRKTPTPAGIAYGELFGWLVGSIITDRYDYLDSFFVYELRKEGDVRIIWNKEGTTSFSIPEEWEGATVDEILSGKVPRNTERWYGEGIRALVKKNPELQTVLWGALPGR